MEKALACAWRCRLGLDAAGPGCRAAGWRCRRARGAWRGAGREGRPRALQAPRVSHRRARLLARWAKLTARDAPSHARCNFRDLPFKYLKISCFSHIKRFPTFVLLFLIWRLWDGLECLYTSHFQTHRRTVIGMGCL